MRNINFLFCLLFSISACSAPVREGIVGSFRKIDEVNPCLSPEQDSLFLCPIAGDQVAWESKDVFNPSAVVVGDKVHLLYRAEDQLAEVKGTSRVGLAISEDGYHFSRTPKPVIYPDYDEWQQYEWPGGIEDPRVVYDAETQRYIMTYTGYDGKTARLMVATSPDLKSWQKFGPAFKNNVDVWSKSGSIVTRLNDQGQFVAERIQGKFWMYWGDSSIFVATSDDLKNWDILKNKDGGFVEVVKTRPYSFDSQLVEPGPQAVIRPNGILLIYNSQNAFSKERDKTLKMGAYTPGQVLLNLEHPQQVLYRTEKPLMIPDRPYEIDGQVGKVVFVEGLVYFKEKWLIYYGTGDSKIAVAESDTIDLK